MSQGVKPAHQKRSRKTRDKLLKAMEELLLEKDFMDISVAELAARASVSPATIYRRFDRKDGFLPVLFDLYMTRLGEWAQSPEARVDIEKMSLKEALEAMAETAWRQLKAQAHMMRAIDLYGHRHLALMGPQRADFEAATLAAMTALVAYYQDDISHAEPETAAHMMAYYINTIFIERGLYPETGSFTEQPAADAVFVREVARFAYGYLTADSMAKTATP